ncbi:hydantoinase/oxoprolinase family protein [Aminobacter niigataensis]|uniref:hydantoinase/oxoprolinase family protein n=1 Tax=Aminobacter niigataensis TaxID=83265 RepID=UPI0024C63B4A|nr:hydantoinase/oxoprolinase family protein [Aminobacter niigataensis]CAI2931842.1 N-methylhydantoinase A [Aminobacter niigataensis]
MIRLATDVGGTFTDLIAYDERDGQLFFSKSLTTVGDQSIGVLDAIALAENNGMDAAGVGFFVHGGTTVINAITERKGVRTALITTEGFRDVLEIGRGNRPDLYNLRSRTPEAFVPRHLRLEVEERLDARGEVLTDLKESDIFDCIATLKAEKVEAVGIIFLHSYINPAHEMRCAEIIREALPEVSVCASHEISRQWREYERSNTVALNAFVQPIIRRYFRNLEQALAVKGLHCPYYAMQSNGGIASFDKVVATPLTLVESGPSGGVAGAARIGSVIGEPDVLYLDVGGTTAKCSLILNSQPKLDSEYRLEKTRLSPGYSVQVPVVDIVEVGTGGGSIAWIDAIGRLRVGPQSAGSTPGPACYGRGGTLATVTDAKLIVGVLDPANFAEGRLALDVGLARKAVETVAQSLNTSIEAAAEAILRVAEETMINALKLVTIQRGHDPRDLALIVSGGAGPMLGARLGRELNVRKTIIPTHPGVFSAWGMLAARPRADLRRTVFGRVDDAGIALVNRLFEELEREAVNYFDLPSVDGLVLTPMLEMRYRGQEHSVSVNFDRSGSISSLLESFNSAHEKAFSFDLPGTSVEFTTIHLQAEAVSDVIRVAPITSEGLNVDVAVKGSRNVYFGEDEGWHQCTVYDRTKIPFGVALNGPALIEEPTTTTLILSGQQFNIDEFGQLIIF